MLNQANSLGLLENLIFSINVNLELVTGKTNIIFANLKDKDNEYYHMYVS